MVADRLAGLKHGEVGGGHGRQTGKNAALTQAEAAMTMGVSERSIRQAREIRQVAPELAEKVEAGEMTLGAEIADLRVNVSHESDLWGPSGMIYWRRACDGGPLRLLAHYEEVACWDLARPAGRALQ